MEYMQVDQVLNIDGNLVNCSIINKSNTDIDIRVGMWIPKLKDYCEQSIDRFIEESINLNNCLKFKELCEKYELNSRISEHCLNFINDNLLEVLDLDEFSELSYENVENFFTDPATGCDNIPLIDLIKVLGKWVTKDIKDRAHDYQKLLSVLDWSNCPKELFDYLSKDKLFEQNKICLYYVLNMMEQRNIDLGKFQSNYSKLRNQFDVENTNNSNALVKTRSSTRNSIRNSTRSSTRNTTKKRAYQPSPPPQQLSIVHVESLDNDSNPEFDDMDDSEYDIELNSDNKELLSMKTEYSVRGKKHSATLAQWKEGVKCPKCTYVGHSAPRLEQHLSKVHQVDTTYTCKYCKFTCKWNREYYKHMKTHFDGPPYNCSECKYTCDRVQFILSHLMRHTDERPFACDKCNFRSRTKGNLVVHYRIHTGEKPYKCQYCDKKFAMKNTLDQHMATHCDDRPYLCDKCGFTTKYQSHLLSHKRIHTGNVFHCEEPNCNYFSPRKSQLAAHVRSHKAIRNHICPTCSRPFIERSHLIRHERIHLDEKPFKCDQCDYGSTRRDKLKEHVIKHHNQNGEKTFKPRKSKKNESTSTSINSTIITNSKQIQPIQQQQIQFVHFENADQIPEEVKEQIIMAHYQNQSIDTQNVTLTIGDGVYESELIVTPVNSTDQIKNTDSNDESAPNTPPELQISNSPSMANDQSNDQEGVNTLDVVELIISSSCQ